jgi:putative ABC transport system permease protein
MLKNYLKIAFRSLWRSKLHSGINILGLSLGIACCILIALFVKEEWTFDAFHTKADRIYRAYGKENWGENQEFFYTNTPFPMGPALKDNLPEVEMQARISAVGTQVKVGENLFNETVTITDHDFFQMFDFEILKGNRKDALAKQSSIVISDGVARKYFGETDPINKIISVQLGENFEDFNVSAVTTVPTNSSIQFSVLISELNLPKLYNEQTLNSAWFNITPETYVMLRADADVKMVTNKFPALFKTLLGEQRFNESKYAPGLQPLKTIHLDTSYPAGNAPVSDPKYALILAAIAVLILFVACINFVTLSIGRSMKRAREVGVRKVVGAARRQLVFQFIGEALIVTFISLLLGCVMALLDLPLFNALSGKQLVLSVNGFTVVTMGALLLIIGLIAGSYPAFLLSGFRPITILRGNITGASNKQGLRKVLIGVQLVLSIFLISSTLVMQNQLSFLQNKNLGFNKDQLMIVQLNVPRGGRLAERVGKGLEKAEQFKAELRSPDIAGICAASHDFARGGWTNVGFTDDKGTYRTFNLNIVDDEYISVLKMEMAEGRNFSDENPGDKRHSVVVNEAFARSYGWSSALGKKIPGKNFADHEIIGVVKDFNYASLYNKVEPLVLVEDVAILSPGIENINIDNSPVPKLMIRLKPGNMQTTISYVKGVWEKLTSGEEFIFSFTDEALAAQYRSDRQLGKIVNIATMLAIIIGSLGLYGLASLAMQNRTKEISIRKVMGATEKSLLLLLSKEYVMMILIALILSVPITWYLMNNWLASFEYRVDIGVDVFILSGVVSLLIAMITISYQAFKTAWSQPAQTLKYE